MLVVRARDAADRTAARLRLRGHEPIVAPLAEVLPTGAPIPAGPFRAILVTSQNAAAPMSRAREALGSLPVYGVGARTAAALQEAGFAGIRSADGDAGDLARLVSAAIPTPAVLLHVAGQDRKPEPARTLTARGYGLAVWEAYRTRRDAVLPDLLSAVLRAGRVDAVLHFSRRSADHLIRLAGDAELLPALCRATHVCLSDDVAAVWNGRGGARAVVAARPDELSLLDALDSLMPPRNSGSPPPQSG